MVKYSLFEDACYTKNFDSSLSQVSIIKFDSEDLVFRLSGISSQVFLDIFENNLEISLVQKKLLDEGHDKNKIEKFLNQFMKDLSERKIIHISND